MEILGRLFFRASLESDGQRWEEEMIHCTRESGSQRADRTQICSNRLIIFQSVLLEQLIRDDSAIFPAHSRAIPVICGEALPQPSHRVVVGASIVRIGVGNARHMNVTNWP